MIEGELIEVRWTNPHAHLKVRTVDKSEKADGEGRRLLELPSVKFDISKADLGSFAGEYRSDELDVTYTVALRDSSLVVQSSTLHPVFKEAFVGNYVGVVRFSRDARGAVAGFTLNRNAARGVRFERVKRQ